MRLFYELVFLVSVFYFLHLGAHKLSDWRESWAISSKKRLDIVACDTPLDCQYLLDDGKKCPEGQEIQYGPNRIMPGHGIWCEEAK